jgi:cysteinyl-tRNA synthetase
MHNGHLQVEGEKMSKSLGNFVTIHELLHSDKFGGRSWPGEVLRLALLRTHYRQPIDFTVKALEEAEKTLREWHLLAHAMRLPPDAPLAAIPQRPVYPPLLEAMCDDFNTHAALMAIHELRNSIVHQTSNANVTALTDSLRFLGLYSDEIGDVLKLSVAERELVDVGVAARNAARAAKNWKESDRIRDELAAMGIALKDNKDGTTTWEVKR